jgi:hypothetical protein
MHGSSPVQAFHQVLYVYCQLPPQDVVYCFWYVLPMLALYCLCNGAVVFICDAVISAFPYRPKWIAPGWDHVHLSLSGRAGTCPDLSCGLFAWLSGQLVTAFPGILVLQRAADHNNRTYYKKSERCSPSHIGM